ncbi:MAG: sulfotransferase family 2 domain-containing protein [Ornithinimicrobium sp.]
MLAQRTWKYRVRALIRATAGEPAFNRLDAWRRWRYYRRAGVVFIHVPKAAGSTVATWLYGQRLGHHRAKDLMRESPDDWRRLRKVAVLREPVERLLSAYTFVFDQGTEEGAIRWRPEYDDPRMRDLNYFVQSYLSTDLEGKDPVFQPQASYVSDEGGEVAEGVECYPIHRLQQMIDSIEVSQARRPMTNSNEQPRKDRPVLDRTSREIVSRVYADDFALWHTYGRFDSAERPD